MENITPATHLVRDPNGRSYLAEPTILNEDDEYWIVATPP